MLQQQNGKGEFGKRIFLTLHSANFRNLVCEGLKHFLYECTVAKLVQRSSFNLGGKAAVHFKLKEIEYCIVKCQGGE